MSKVAVNLRVKGLVQGVGFRPFVYRIALVAGIKGWVNNDNLGVSIVAEGNADAVAQFKSALVNELPAAAYIAEIQEERVEIQNFESFNILQSNNHSDEVTEVSPDIAVCEDCLRDMRAQSHRIAYPFINCTNCGPRFTIIRALPYDRHQTTMDVFEMCDTCRSEYEAVTDRRFHAQPVACNHCGPTYQIHGHDVTSSDIAKVVSIWLDEGKIIALKGLGGFHLLCDATNNVAVTTLRQRKNREGKPMAVMMLSTEAAEQYFFMSGEERSTLTSWRRPIVLLRNKHSLAQSVSNGMNTTGIVLPYMPFHYQLFENLKTPAIVLTSGNFSDEPVVIDNALAKSDLGSIADHFVSYNRAIHNRADDSVVMVVAEKERMIRRSRAYVPASIAIQIPTEGIFAAGAELVNTFAIGKGSTAILSQHIGDLKNAPTFEFYQESIGRFSSLFRFTPSLVACDLHPDYMSSAFAEKMNIPLEYVQHHHAHIAACMAEHKLDRKVIGIAFDGTGLGDDGTIWGGEFFVCDLSAYERKYYFDPVPLPGGDRVTEEPWRTAVSYLYKYLGPTVFDQELAFLYDIPKEKIQLLLQAIDKGLNCPLSSGAGRLFDAVAALTGICTHSSFHAEAPMRLEAAIVKDCKSKYLFDIEDKRITFMKLFYLILKDMRNGITQDVISAKFHNTMLAVMLTVSRKLKAETGINSVVLSGGSFQNRYLLENALHMFQEQGFEVYAHEKVPSNDGGIALGQMAVAAKRRAEKQSN
ncbi:MAG: hydrogenase maturation protein HypF [Bacteroidetes bacterium]|nr:MAG: hydrogenase maturation protein HypF [Bacteroidota bacterium]